MDALDELFADIDMMDDPFADAAAGGPRSCSGVRTPVVLPGFLLDRDAPRPAHTPLLRRIAACVVASHATTRPIRMLRIVGHTDPSGSHTHNLRLGLRRATQVRRRIESMIEALRPGLTGRLRFVVTSLGERRLVAAEPARNRRVEVFLGTAPEALCGIPRRPSGARERLAARTIAARRRSVVRGPVEANLVLYQVVAPPEHQHFQDCAERWAPMVRAVGPAGASRAPLRIGATPYVDGADLIARVVSARHRLGRPIQRVDIFSHGVPRGIGGRLPYSHGLYLPDGGPRTGGGRWLTQLPLAPFASNVIFVLHGCRLAANAARPDSYKERCNMLPSDHNFARALLLHLLSAHPNARVFGHCSSGCAGRDCNWREYSRVARTGRAIQGPLRGLYREVCCRDGCGRPRPTAPAISPRPPTLRA